MKFKIANNILALIGNTPLVKLGRITEPGMAEVLAKVESFNPGGSVKDRIALSMIEVAEKKGKLKPGWTIVEPTSGNTGIGLAMVSAVKGYRCIVVMPGGMSVERQNILKSFGASVVLTPEDEGMQGAIKKAEELLKETPRSFMPNQFKNPANPEIHRGTTAREILKITGNKIEAFIAGVGTGGTITGVGEVLKKKNPKVKIVAVEPKGSAVLSLQKYGPPQNRRASEQAGEKPGSHKIQGIGAGFIPEVLNVDIINEIVQVSDNDAINTAHRLAREEGLFVGPSGGAAVWAALKVAKDLGESKRIVVILPDSGQRYISNATF